MKLPGTWRAAVADEDLRRRFPDPHFDDGAWSEVDVPGHWQSTPEFATSDGPMLYRRSFEHRRLRDDERAWLTLDGIFYQADIWLDGALVGDTEGYFAAHTFEITAPLNNRREHVLAAEVACAPETDRDRKRNLTGSFQSGPFRDDGWNPGGIWQPVHVHTTGRTAINRLRVACVEASAERATLAFDAILDTLDDVEVGLRTTVGGRDEHHEETHRLAAGTNRVEWTVAIDRPRLWWPHALGDPDLTPVDVTVTRDAAVSDRRTIVTGVRRVQMTDFVLTVNGERLFLKGATVGPTRPDRRELGGDEIERAGEVVDRAIDAGLDLIRLHSHVARPEFYDAADRRGLLLWQDMPLHGGYSRSIRKQAARQAEAAVDRFGHHPSIAIWCGHDEPFPADAAPQRAVGSAGRIGRSLAGLAVPTYTKTVLDGSVERALHRADPSRPVVAHAGVLGRTDAHLAFGWSQGDERDFAGFAAKWPRAVRFVGAFGTPPDCFTTEPAGVGADDDRRAAIVRHHIETLRTLKYAPTGGFTVTGLPRSSSSVHAALSGACRPEIVVVERPAAAYRPGDAVALAVHVVSDRREPLRAAVVDVVLTWPNGAPVRRRWVGDVDADSVAMVGTIEATVPDTEGCARIDVRLFRDGTLDDVIADGTDALAVNGYDFDVRQA